MSARRRFIRDVCITLLILGAVGYFIVLPIWPFMVAGPPGPNIPRTPPDESRRVHCGGFSMVLPEDWDLNEVDLQGSLIMHSHLPVPRRVPGMITVSKIEPPADERLQEMTPRAFRDYPAYERMRFKREYSFDDEAWSVYELLINRDGQWYEVTYGINRERTDLPEMVGRYIDTLEWEID